jgi:hypothetical protein
MWRTYGTQNGRCLLRYRYCAPAAPVCFGGGRGYKSFNPFILKIMVQTMASSAPVKLNLETTVAQR